MPRVDKKLYVGIGADALMGISRWLIIFNSGGAFGLPVLGTVELALEPSVSVKHVVEGENTFQSATSGPRPC